MQKKLILSPKETHPSQSDLWEDEKSDALLGNLLPSEPSSTPQPEPQEEPPPVTPEENT
jgi:hypothetical protein